MKGGDAGSEAGPGGVCPALVENRRGDKAGDGRSERCCDSEGRKIGVKRVSYDICKG